MNLGFLYQKVIGPPFKYLHSDLLILFIIRIDVEFTYYCTLVLLIEFIYYKCADILLYPNTIRYNRKT